MENKRSLKRLAKESIDSLASSIKSTKEEEESSTTRLQRSAKVKAKEAIHDLYNHHNNTHKASSTLTNSNKLKVIKIDNLDKSQEDKSRGRSKSSSKSGNTSSDSLSDSSPTQAASSGVISTHYSRNTKESILNRRQSTASTSFSLSSIPNKKPRISANSIDNHRLDSLLVSDSTIDIGDTNTNSPLSSNTNTNTSRSNTKSNTKEEEESSTTRLQRSAKVKAKEAIHDLYNHHNNTHKASSTLTNSNKLKVIKIDNLDKSQEDKSRGRSKSSSKSSNTSSDSLSDSSPTQAASSGVISTHYSRNTKESILNRRQSTASTSFSLSSIPNKKPRISANSIDNHRLDSLLVSDSTIDIGDTNTNSPLSSNTNTNTSRSNTKSNTKETGGCITRPTSRRRSQHRDQHHHHQQASIYTQPIGIIPTTTQQSVPIATNKSRRLLRMSSNTNNQQNTNNSSDASNPTTSTLTSSTAGNASSATTGSTTFASFLLGKSSTSSHGANNLVASSTQSSTAAQSVLNAVRPLSESESDTDNTDFGRLADILQARGLPSHVVNVFGSKVQQFLHRTMSSGSSNRAQQLIQCLQSPDDTVKLTALSELCQLLVMGNEDTLVGFPVKQAVTLLVQCMSIDNGNYDLMNHACRALTYMMESLPRSSSIIAEGIPVFLEKLQVIQCMDVAEQALKALEILSRRHSKQILHANGISSVLMFIDFFSIAAQRNALQIAANCCQSMIKEEFVHVQSSLAILAQRLTHSDKKSAESVCTIFSRLVENFQRDPLILKEISSHNLLSNMKKILLVQPQVVSSSIFVIILHTINVVCMNCTEMSVDLLLEGIGDTLKYLLVGKNHELITRAPQELYEIVSLIGEIMPKLPNTGVFSIDDILRKSSHNHQTNQIIWQWKDEREVWRPYTPVDSRLIEGAFAQEEEEISLSTMGRQYVIDFNTMLQINEESGTARPVLRKTHSQNANTNDTSVQLDIDYRVENLAKNQQFYFDFVRKLFAILYEVYSSSAGPAIKHRCLRALLRMIYYSNADLLNDVLKNLTISSHISSMLASQDLKIIVSALQMSEILIEKLPSIFTIYFHREGVLHQIDLLIESFKPSPLEPTQSQIQSQPMSVESIQPQVQPVRKLKQSKKKDACRRSINEDTSTTNQEARTSTQSRNEFSFFGSHLWGQLKSSNRSKSSSTIQNRHDELQQQQQQQLSSQENQINDMTYNLVNFNKESVRKWIYEQTKRFKEQYFSLDTQKDETSTQLMRSVEKLDRHSLEALREIANIIHETDVSSFEMIHSGLITKLVEFFTNETSHSSKIERIRQFLDVFAQINDHEQFSMANTSLLESFIGKLQNCTSQLEQYAVKVNDMPLSIGSGKTAMKFFNTHQIKCLLQRHQDSHTLIREWKNGPVKVDPLAQVSAIERYLTLRRINKPPSTQSSNNTNVGESDEDDDSENDSEDDIEEAMSAILGRSTNDDGPKLELLLNGQVLPSNMTIYQAIKQYSHVDTDNEGDSESFMVNEIWSKVHTLFYRVAAATTTATSIVSNKQPTVIASSLTSPSSTSQEKRTTRFVKSSKESKLSKQVSSELTLEHNKKIAFDEINTTWKQALTISDLSLNAISLLRILNILNRKWYLAYSSSSTTYNKVTNDYLHILNSNDFVNTKLTSKAKRQLQDPLVIMTGHLPKWLPELVKTCQFLFPFETRLMYFYVSTFDRDRSMLKLLDMTSNESGTHQTQSPQASAAKLDRKKKTINRDELLKNAETILNDFTKSKALLEIQYENEVGTGLGPTLEFYALVSLELQKCDYELWRGDRVKILSANGANKNQLFFQSTNGLFPAPLAKNAKQHHITKIKSKFKFFGRFVAKAIMDFRVLDIQLNHVFYKYILDANSLGDIDLKFIDPCLFKSIESLRAYLRKQQKLLAQKSQALTKAEAKVIDNELICLDKTVRDLELDFTLPGYATIELKKNGKDLHVTIHNLDEYIKLVTQYTLVDGVHKQFESFKEGFNSIIPIASLTSFYPEELERLFCGSGFDLWDSKLLNECTRCDHGYTHDSKAVKYLFDIMCSFNVDEQRLFLQFVTGSPRLPVGGLKSLVPQLTIVRKTIENNDNPDNYLPSVMTCVNYLKLPEYTSQEKMKDKLMKAMTDGQLSFNLS